MGGSNSGRWGGKPTVEGCQSLVLPVSAVIGRQNSKRFQGWRSTLRFVNSYTDDATSVRFETFLDREEMVGHVDLSHKGRDRAGTPQAYRVHFYATRQPFGGLRWWFMCPLTCDWACKLYLPQGAAVFGSRRAYRLGYASTRQTDAARAFEQRRKLEKAMGGTVGPDGELMKPPRQHWRTWERKEARLDAAEEACDRHLYASALRLGMLRATLVS